MVVTVVVTVVVTMTVTVKVVVTVVLTVMVKGVGGEGVSAEVKGFQFLTQREVSRVVA